MEDTPRKGFWNWITASERTTGTYSESLSEPLGTGSVLSAGGTSPLPGIIPPARPVHGLLDVRTAKGISPVTRAISIISGSLAQLPVDVFRQGESVELSSLMKRPDTRFSRGTFLALAGNQLASYGNSYWRLHRFDEKDPISPVQRIELFNPEFVAVELKNGRNVYHYGDAKFNDWQIHHAMVNPDFDSATGLVMGFGPIQRNRAELQGILDMQRYISDFFLNNGVPTGILTTDFELEPEIATAIRNRWYEVDAFGGIQILPNGLKFQAISLNPEQTQYVMAAQKAVVDVARMFGIPSNLMLAPVEGTSTTYSNVQDDMRIFVQHTLMPFAQAIEDAFTEVTPNGQSVKFNFGGFLRGDTKSRYEAHKTGIEAGFLTIDEVRALEDLAPLNPTEGETPDN